MNTSNWGGMFFPVLLLSHSLSPCGYRGWGSRQDTRNARPVTRERWRPGGSMLATAARFLIKQEYGTFRKNATGEFRISRKMPRNRLQYRFAVYLLILGLRKLSRVIALVYQNANPTFRHSACRQTHHNTKMYKTCNINLCEFQKVV
jgi:hypothetical protein